MARISLIALGAALTLSACAHTSGTSTAKAAPTPRGLVRLRARTGNVIDLRLLRADTAVEVTVRAKGDASTAPRVIVPMSSARARALADTIFLSTTRGAGGPNYVPLPGVTTRTGLYLVPMTATPRWNEPAVAFEAREDGESPLRVELTVMEARGLAAALRHGAEAVRRAPGIDTTTWAWNDFELDSPIRPAKGGCSPHYPEQLRQQSVTGDVEMEFVVNALGRVDTATAVTRWAADPAFAQAVRAALPCVRYVPARRDGRDVPAVAVQSFWFNIANHVAAEPSSLPGAPR